MVNNFDNFDDLEKRLWNDFGVKSSRSLDPNYIREEAIKRKELPAFSKQKVLTKKISYSVCGIMLVVAGTIAAGFTSPVMAAKIEKIPVIGNVFNLLTSKWFTTPGVEQAARNGFTKMVNQTVNDQGITLTIGNVFFDKDQLWFDIVESFDSNLKEKPVLAMGSQGMQLEMDHQQIKNFSGGELRQVEGGKYAGVGVVFASNLGPNYQFPETSQINFHISQIGKIKGNWDFAFSVSRKEVDQNVKTYNPNLAKTMKDITLTVDSISIGPAATDIEYELSAPSSYVYAPGIWVGIEDDQGNLLNGRAAPSGLPVNTTGIHNIWKFRGSYDSPKKIPKYLQISPYYGPTIRFELEDQSQTINKTFLVGSDEEVTFTQIESLPDKTLIHLKTKGLEFKNSDPYNLVMSEPLKVPGPVKEVLPLKTTVENEQEHVAIMEFPPLPQELPQGFHCILGTKSGQQAKGNIPIKDLQFEVPLSK